MSDIGMAIAKMREIVADCQQAQQYLRQIESDVDGRVRNLQSVWQGESVGAYTDRWSKAQGQMDEAVFTVDEIRVLLDQAINELIQADQRGAAAAR